MDCSLKYVPTDDCDYPSQPRSDTDPEYCRSLGENMKAEGQKEPVLGYTDSVSGRFVLIDGGCRLQAAKLLGIPHLLAMDMGKKPTVAELLMAQAAIDRFKQHLKPMDRARLWHANMKERGWTARQMAQGMKVSDSLVADYESLLTLPPDLQEQVNSGALPMSKASFIAQQESDPARQRELAALAKDLSRKDFTAKVRQSRRTAQQQEVRVNSLRCPSPSGTTVVVKGRNLTLLDAIQALTDLLKAMKKAADEGIDGKTFARMCADKAKAR